MWRGTRVTSKICVDLLGLYNSFGDISKNSCKTNNNNNLVWHRPKFTLFSLGLNVFYKFAFLKTWIIFWLEKWPYLPVKWQFFFFFFPKYFGTGTLTVETVLSKYIRYENAKKSWGMRLRIGTATFKSILTQFSVKILSGWTPGAEQWRHREIRDRCGMHTKPYCGPRVRSKTSHNQTKYEPIST